MSRPNQCNILVLNDDCFYHIYKFLPIIDWCSLRDTCTRFRTISDYCFDRRSETFELKQMSDLPYELDFSELMCVLRHFGRHMKTLTINKNHFSESINCNMLVRHVNRYCQSLNDLKLVNFDLALPTIAQCSRLFSSLQRLVIDKLDDEKCLTDCLIHCTSLKELEFIRLFMTFDCLANSHINSLESFKMSGCEDTSYEAIKSFLTTNGQLTQVKLFDLQVRDGEQSSGIIKFIADNLPKVEALSLHFNIAFMPDLLPVLDMASLKKLEMNVTYHSGDIVNQLLRGLAERNNLEELLLAQLECSPESIGYLSSMKSLKTLKLVDANGLGNEHVCTTLATGLTSLDQIHIVECKGASFVAVKEFCVHVPNLKKIIFNRADDADPSITQEMFASFVAVRKGRATREILLIFLNDDDLREIDNEFEWSGVKGTVAKEANVLKVVSLEKEHRSTVYEYGSGFRIGRRIYFGEVGDVDESDYEMDLGDSDSGDIWSFG